MIESLRSLAAVPMLLFLWATIGAAQEGAPKLRLEEDLRIGSVDEPDYSLSRVAGIAVGPEGEVYVGQPMEGSVRVYDRSGRYLRSIGRKGNGPGEFHTIGALGLLGDTLWVIDSYHPRVTLFGTDGALLQTGTVDGPMLELSVRPTMPDRMLADRSVLGRPLIGDRPEVRHLPLLRMDLSGALLNPLGQLQVQGANVTIRTQRIKAVAKLPAPSHTLWSPTPDGTTVVFVHRPPAEDAEAGRITAVMLRPDGDTVYSRRFRYRPHAFPSEKADSIREGYAKFWSQAIPFDEAREIARDSLPMPRFLPPVTALTVAKDHSVWLERERLSRTGSEWLVLGPDGRIQAEVATPRKVEILAVEGEHAWGVETDELEVPYVVRYRIRAVMR